MDYLKIAEIANKCEVKRQQIGEYYRLIGANNQLAEEAKHAIYAVIKDLEIEKKGFEKRLIKHIENKTV